MVGQRQRIDVAPPMPARASLRTGKLFLLVLPTHRVLYAGWDKSRYAPGETARLLVRGQSLGHLDLIVERAAEDGAWAEASRLQSSPPASAAAAEAAHSFPPLPAPRSSEGQLMQAGFARARFSPGEEVGLEILASGLEGARLVITVEREAGPDAWESAASLEGTIVQGRCGIGWRPPMPQPRGPGIEACAFEGGGPTPGLAVLLARAPGLEGAQLSFELEREEARGAFVACRSAVATVHEGVARARVALEGRDG